MDESKQRKLQERTEALPLYPSARAFVIRMPRSAGPDDVPLLGRVEHLQSCSGREFAGAEDLLAFIRTVLASKG